MTDDQQPSDPNATRSAPAPVEGSGWVQPALAAVPPPVEGSGWVQPAAVAAAAAGPAWGQPATPETAPAAPSPAQPAAPSQSGWGQPQPTQGWVQPSEAKGRVTILARLAGVVLIIMGVFWGAVGALFIVGGTVFHVVTDQFGALDTNVDASRVDAAGNIVGGVLAGFGIVILVLALVEVFGGIGVLFGKGFGRAIGIFYSLVFGAVLLLGVSGGMRASDATGSQAATGGIVILLVMFLLYLYALIVLLLRWRGSARA